MDLSIMAQRLLDRGRPLVANATLPPGSDTQWSQSWLDACAAYANGLSREQQFTWAILCAGIRPPPLREPSEWPYKDPMTLTDLQWYLLIDRMFRTRFRAYANLNVDADVAARYGLTAEQVQALHKPLIRLRMASLRAIWPRDTAPTVLTRDLRAFKLHEYIYGRAIFYLPQIAIVVGVPFSRRGLRASVSRLDVATWARVIEAYHRDVAALIAAAPPLPTSVTVYRVSQWKGRRWHDDYVLARSSEARAARDRPDVHTLALIDKYVHRIRLRRGLRVLPLWMLIPETAADGEVMLPPKAVRCG